MGWLQDMLGISQQKESRKMSELQRQIARQQQQMFEYTSPQYKQALQYFARRAMPGGGMPGGGGGLFGQALGATPGIAGSQGVPGQPQGKPGFGKRPGAYLQGGTQPAPLLTATGRPGGMASIQPMGRAGPDAYAAQGLLPNSALGIYGQDPAEVFRMQQADEAISRMASQRGNQLSYRLGQQGIGGGTMAAALGQNEQDAFRQLANFRRQQAVGAGQEEERRMLQWLQAMGVGLGAGPQAGQMLGQQAAMSGQQAAAQQQQLMQLAMMFAL